MKINGIFHELADIPPIIKRPDTVAQAKILEIEFLTDFKYFQPLDICPRYFMNEISICQRPEIIDDGLCWNTYLLRFEVFTDILRGKEATGVIGEISDQVFQKRYIADICAAYDIS